MVHFHSKVENWLEFELGDISSMATTFGFAIAAAAAMKSFSKV